MLLVALTLFDAVFDRVAMNEQGFGGAGDLTLTIQVSPQGFAQLMVASFAETLIL